MSSFSISFMLIAQVVLPVKLYRLFDYQIPSQFTNLITVGQRVKVPFGKRNIIGIVASLASESHYDIEKLKPIEEVIDQQPILPKNLWQLLLWAANYYHYPLGEVLFHALPVLLRQGKKAVEEGEKVWQITNKGIDANLADFSRSPKQQLLLNQFKIHIFSNKINNLEINPSTYKTLEKQELIQRTILYPQQTQWQGQFTVSLSPFMLNDEQYKTIQAINQSNHHFQGYLLEGVTGSGKTEVYLNILANILEKGKQALVLVPEIGLTPQTIARFKARFNAPIDILHSGLTDKERLAVWLRSKNGENAIVVGTRSAIFTPFKQLGMMIIDEEHDSSYKQQEGWRYHARDLSIVRAKMENIPIVLGSATPALESINNAQAGRYHHLYLTQRAGNATFAKQTILDIKGLPLRSGLSQPLIVQIRQHLANNNQVLLFLNRRGFSPLMICHDCGWIAECPRCDSAYTYHQKKQKLICHHCDSHRNIPKQCPKCGSTHLVPLGFGTEQIEKQLVELFPEVPVTRIDRDSISKKGSLEAHLQAVQQGGKHILVGTQILAKGHHFPDVTLVGLIDVDGALFSEDFRATERFAQLYTQVSGRAGRENKAGEVILQTYHPTHPLLNILLHEGYQSFAKQTLQERQQAMLPPFSHQVLFHAADRNNHDAQLFLHKIYCWMSNHKEQTLWLLGPMQSSYAKRAGWNRWQLLIQCPYRKILQTLVHQLLIDIETWSESKNIKWNIDIDPIDTF